MQTGTPIQIGNGQNALNIFSANQRASATGVDPFVRGPISDRLNHYFNQAAFVNNIDFSLFKNVKFRESMTAQFRGEAYNHPYWNNPGTTVNDLANFGVVNTKGGQRRIMQLGLKLIF